MSEKRKNVILVCMMAAMLFGVSLCCWLKKADDFSESERRVLASFPELSGETLLSGKFVKDFESYTLDQFPCRESFRRLKAVTSLGVFGRRDNNGIYVEDGYVSKINYPLNEDMLEHAADCFRRLYDTYLSDMDGHLYFSVVPDKNYYLAASNGRLSLDYKALIDVMRKKTEYMKYIDITDLLDIDNYYKTDTHWRQETLLPVAKRLAKAMNIHVSEEYNVNTLEYPFYGVYIGQSALPLKPDTISYLTNSTLDSCTVTSYSTGKPVRRSLYDMEKAAGADAYEMFLSGAEALLVIENPATSSEKELIVFRDSFGSSLVPLLVEGYHKITLIDIRYINSAALRNFVQFGGQDVLFLYSTLLLNDSLALE